MQKTIGNMSIQSAEEEKRTQREMAKQRTIATETLINKGIFKKNVNLEVTRRGINNLNFGATRGLSDLASLNGNDSAVPSLDSLYYRISNIITNSAYNQNNFSLLYKMFDGLEKMVTQKLKENPSAKEEILNNFDEFKALIDGKYSDYSFIEDKLEQIKKTIDETKYIKSLEQKENDVIKDFIMKSVVDGKSNYARSNLDVFNYLDDLQGIDEEMKENIKEQVIAKHNEENVKNMTSEELDKYKDNAVNQNDGSYKHFLAKTKPILSQLVNDNLSLAEFEKIVPKQNNSKQSLKSYFDNLNSIRNQIEKNMFDLDKALEFIEVLEDTATAAKDTRAGMMSDAEKKSYDEFIRKLGLCVGKIMVIRKQKEEFEKNNKNAQQTPDDIDKGIVVLKKKIQNVELPTPANNDQTTILRSILNVMRENVQFDDFNSIAVAVSNSLDTLEKDAPRILYFNPRHKFFRKNDIEKLSELFKSNPKYKDLDKDQTIVAILNAIQSALYEGADDVNQVLFQEFKVVVHASNDITSFSLSKNIEEVETGQGAVFIPQIQDMFDYLLSYVLGNRMVNAADAPPLPFFNRRPTNQYDVVMFGLSRLFNVIDAFTGIRQDNDTTGLITYIILGLLILYILFLHRILLMQRNNNNNLPQIVFLQPRIGDIPDAQAQAQLMIPAPPTPAPPAVGRRRGAGNITGGQSILSKLRLTNESSFPRNSQKFIDTYGDQNVTRMIISRSLVSEAAQKLYTGKVIDNKTKIPYDQIFHLKLILHLENGVVARVEKIPQVAINYNIESEDGELVEVPMDGNVFTLNELIDTTIKNMGTKDFFRYHAFTYNCQNLVLNFINSAGLLTQEIEDFVMQFGNEEQFKKDYRARYEFGNFVTDLGNVASRVTGGSEGDYY